MNIYNKNFVIIDENGEVLGDIENDVYVFISNELAEAYINSNPGLQSLKVVELILKPDILKTEHEDKT